MHGRQAGAAMRVAISRGVTNVAESQPLGDQGCSQGGMESPTLDYALIKRGRAMAASSMLIGANVIAVVGRRQGLMRI